MKKFILLTVFTSFFSLVKAQQVDQTEEIPLCPVGECTCADFVVPAGVMIGRLHAKNEWMFSYRFMSMSMSGPLQGTENIDANAVFLKYLMSPDQMTMDMHMPMVMYGISNRLTVMAMANIVSNKMSMDMFAVAGHSHGGESHDHSDGKHHMNSNGFGDVKLYAMYGIVKTDRRQLVLNTGISLPTGFIAIQGVEGDAFYDGARYPYAMQLGSGTVDILPGISWFSQVGKFGLAVQSNATVRLGTSQFNYSLGNELQSNVWSSYNLLSFLRPSIRVESLISGVMKGYDQQLYIYNEPASNPLNYGAHRLTSFTGLQFQHRVAGTFAQLNLEYGLPFYQSVQGIQMKARSVVNASLTLSF